MSQCSTCGTQIVWGNWARSHIRVPIDAEPYEDGNLVIVDTGPDGSPQVDLAHIVEKLRTEHGTIRTANASLFDDVMPTELPPLPPERYKTHFATCSDADQHRRRK